MKKLMFAAAAIAAGVAMADVQSANVVGYAQTGLLKETNSKFITAQFGNVGGTDQPIDIQTIRPADEYGASDGVFLSFLDDLGGTEAMYSWVNWASDPDSGETVCGWIDGNFEYAVGVTINPGDGVWVQCNLEDQGVQSSGQVPEEGVRVLLGKNTGSIGLGNSTPVPLNIQDLRPENEDVCSDNVFLSFLDGLGGTETMYSWVNWASDPDSGEMVCAWIDSNFEYAVGVTINPGDGVWVQCNCEDDQYIIIPGVDLSAK